MSALAFPLPQPKVSKFFSLLTCRTALGLTLALAVATCACSLNSGSSTPAAAATNTAPTISPNTAVLASGGTQRFNVSVANTADTAVTWSATAGTVNSEGIFTAPNVAASTTVLVTATSVADPTKTASASVTVDAASVAAKLAIRTALLPAATAAAAYSAGLEASGGQPPYSWSIAGGALPAGLALTASGALTGTPPQTGSYSFVASVQDSSNQKASQNYSLAVAPNSTGFDGPAQLPLVYVQSSLADTPAPGPTVQVAEGGDFQAALNSAECGETIALQAGALFSGNFTVPAKSCDDAHWIIVRTSAPDSALPPEGTRITPCFAGVASLPGRPSFACSSTKNVMAKIVFEGIGSQPIMLASGVNHMRFLGLEITRTSPGNVIYDLVVLQNGGPTDHLVFDRDWIHGTAQDETTRGIALGGSTYVAVVDSFFTDFHCIAISGSCTDAQAINGGLGDLPMGPYKIVNNFLEAAGQSLLFGGGEATQVPQDLEIRGNHLFKPLLWMQGQPGYIGGSNGNPFIVKNHLELKNGVRLLFEGNVLENNWGGFSQTGFSILLTPKNQSGTCPLCTVHDITIRYGTISNVGNGIVLGDGASDSGALSQGAWNESIHDILIQNVSASAYNGAGYLLQEANGNPVSAIHDVVINHITAIGTDAQAAMLVVGNDVTSPPMGNFGWTNSIFTANAGLLSTGGGSTNCAFQHGPLAIFQACFAPYTFHSNALIGATGTWPAGNFAPPSASVVQFAGASAPSGIAYQLQPSSPFAKAGSDGKDLGADMNAISQAIAGVAP
jgi:Putative Ig domain